MNFLKWLLLDSLLHTFLGKTVNRTTCFRKSYLLYKDLPSSWCSASISMLFVNVKLSRKTTMTQSLETHPGEKGSPIFQSLLKSATPSWPVSWPWKSEPGLVWDKRSLLNQRFEGHRLDLASEDLALEPQKAWSGVFLTCQLWVSECRWPSAILSTPVLLSVVTFRRWRQRVKQNWIDGLWAPLGRIWASMASFISTEDAL